jgi:acyl-CoA synthetase (AMP-forming)/AMP-acid ligase II
MTAASAQAAVDSGWTPPLAGERLRGMAGEDPDKALYTYLPFDDGPPVRLTRAETWRRACAVAAMLSERGLRQRPVLLLYPAGPAFGPAFLGALLAGAVAVPAPAPEFAAQLDRLGGIAEDCAPGAILSTGALRARMLDRLEAGSPLRSCPWLATDVEAAQTPFDPGPAAPSEVALLQYTSGSTAEPKGVTVTHANIAHNLQMLAQAFQPRPGARIVSWLPHFHDMGLVTGLLGPMTCGGESILMSPRGFLSRPLRWLQAISDFRAEISGAPNFAYDLCLRWADRGERPALDLSGWRSAFVGAEPVRMATLEAFADRFGREGFAREALTPCYGMAEATLLVACKPAGTAATTHVLAREAARRGAAEASSEPSGLRLTGCGHPPSDTQIRIVDPERRVVLPAGRIGEAWIAGPQVARGYWNRRGDDDPFGAELAEPDGGRWLRTGDLGFLTQSGEFVFVDRLKDLIIVNGQNHPCHDLELTAAASHPALSAGGCVAAGVEAEDRTHIAVVAELTANALGIAEEVAASIRSSLFTTHALAVRTVAFVPPGRLSRTTSGKLQRRLTAQRLSDGTLQPLAQYGDPLPAHPSGADRPS